MNSIPEDILRLMTNYLVVVECLRLEQAVQKTIHEKRHYLKRKEWEPLTNTIRLFKKGVFRTYRIYSYVEDDVTYSDVYVSPACTSFQCKHRRLITPSKASHWVLACITEGSSEGYGFVKASLKPIRPSLFVSNRSLY